MVRRLSPAGGVVTASLLLLWAAGCRDRPAQPVAEAKSKSNLSTTQRDAALAGARVWVPPTTPIDAVDFSRNPPGDDGFDANADVECAFSPKKGGGTTPKFYCTLKNGDTVKVKYGQPNGEVPSEIAATRLLAALGFPTDRMYRVKSVHCLGCPTLPQQWLQCLDKGGPEALCLQGASSSRVVKFDYAAIERPFDGRKLEAQDDQGWSFHELDRIDPGRGGSPRAHVDALRLIAMLLAHWDNKGENQRLVCPPGNDRPDGSCAAPLAILQDLGATFGPHRMDLPNWRALPMWADAASCRVSMATLPFSGATFADRQISEEGRQFALQLLRPLSRAQLNTLFEATGVTAFSHVMTEAHSPEAWTNAFLAKVDQIASVSPCPRPPT